MLYQIAYSWWEDYSPVLLEGPEVVDWQAFCDTWVPQAATWWMHEHPDEWLGWPDIVNGLVGVLAEHGYHTVEIAEAVYWGPGIIHNIADITGPDSKPDERLRKVLAPVLGAIEVHNARINMLYEQRRNANGYHYG